MQVFIVNVKENLELARSWAIGKHHFTFPVLLDLDGQVSASYAPPDVLPAIPRDQIPIGSNLIIDRQGVIKFYSLLDSKNFDARLIQLQKRLEQLMEKQ